MRRVIDIQRIFATKISLGLAKELLSASIYLPLLLLLALVIWLYGSEIVLSIGIHGADSVTARAVLVSLALGLLFYVTVKRKSAWNPWIFLAISSAVTATVYLSYMKAIHVDWISDFAGMWSSATQMVARGDFAVRSIHEERALPVLVPIVLLFGPNPAAVPLVNVFFLLLIQLAGYDLVRRVSGHQAAQGFVVLWGGAMEPILALAIPSHDIWGLFFLVFFLWNYRICCDRAQALRFIRPGDKLILAACIISSALLLTLLNLQREIAPFVLLGVLLSGMLSTTRRGETRSFLNPIVGVTLSIVLLYVAGNAILKNAHYELASHQRADLTLVRIGAESSSIADGTYRQSQVIKTNFLDPLPMDLRRSLAYSIPFSDLALQPLSRFGNLLYRAPGQAKLGSQYYFYQAGARTSVDWLLPFTRSYNICYSFLLSGLALLVVARTLRMGHPHEIIQLAFLSALIGGLLLVGESQSRYIFPVWFILPQIVGSAFARVAPADSKDAMWQPFGWDMARGTALLFLAYILSALTVRLAYRDSAGRILSGWQPTLQKVAGSPPRGWFERYQNFSAEKIKEESGDHRATGFGKLALVMQIPVAARAGGGVSARREICIGGDRRALDFFYHMPYSNERAQGAFILEVKVNGVSRWTARLPDAARIVHAHVPDILPSYSCGKLEFMLQTTRGIKSRSWISASHTDIYFPRFTE